MKGSDYVIFSNQGCTIDVDGEKTREYYRSISLCDCLTCRNFYAQAQNALPELKEFLGRYGVVKEYAYGDKWKVEFNATTETTGALIHTVSEKDFEVVGKIN